MATNHKYGSSKRDETLGRIAFLNGHNFKEKNTEGSLQATTWGFFLMLGGYLGIDPRLVYYSYTFSLCVTYLL